MIAAGISSPCPSLEVSLLMGTAEQSYGAKLL